MPESRAHGLEQIVDLVGDALERGARDVAGGRAARDARDHARARTDPSAARRVRQTPARDTRRRCRARCAASASTSADGAMMPSPSRSHCTTAPPMKTLPSSAYSVRSADLPRDRREQALRGRDRPRAGVLQQEAAGAVGVLRQARRRAHLAEERRLLIAGDPGDRRRRATPRLRRDCAVDLARGAHLRQHAARAREEPQQLVVPAPRVDVEQHGARRVADVGDVRRAAGQLPDQPGVDGAERELAGARRARARRARCRESTRSWSRKNRRRSRRPVLLANRAPRARRALSRSQTSAVRRSCQTMALWIGSPVSRSQTIVVSRWFVMPMAATSCGRTLRAAERLDRDGDLRGPDFLRVVLDPAGLRKICGNSFCATATMRAVVIEQDGARAGGALIECEDVRHDGRSLCRSVRCIGTAPTSDAACYILRPCPNPTRNPRELLAEFLGTFVLIVFGVGVVAQFVLSRGAAGSYLAINLVWGLGVTMGCYVAGGISGAHLNPAVTLALAVHRGFPWGKVLPYTLAQLAGAFVASAVVYLTYGEALERSTAASVRSWARRARPGSGRRIPSRSSARCRAASSIRWSAPPCSWRSSSPSATRGTPGAAGLAPLIVGLLVVAIGAAFGFNSGYAINPARDFGPRLFTAWPAGAARSSGRATAGGGCPSSRPVGGGARGVALRRLHRWAVSAQPGHRRGTESGPIRPINPDTYRNATVYKEVLYKTTKRLYT